MGLERYFLDWNQPILPVVVAELISRYRNAAGEIDLSQVLAVFPGQQAGRRFLELLAEQSEDQAIPPQVLTVGVLPEYLYQPKQPFASALSQQLAWAEALQGLPRKRLEVVIPQPPDERDLEAWLNLGELIRRQHRELATDQLNFRKVAEAGESLEGFNERERWEVLAEVQESYLKRLDGLGLWDQQTSRLFAIEYNECQTTRDIVLIGTVDLNKTLQSMLRQVLGRVSIYIHAPEELSGCFEEFGNLNPAAWENREIEIDESRIHIVEGPQEQAAQVVLELNELARDYAIDEITVCVPDDRMISHLTRMLEFHHVSANWVIEQTLPETGSYRLLSAVGDSLETNRTDHFSQLIRHPDLGNWINKQDLAATWLSSWDEYVSSHLQRRSEVVLGNDSAAKTARKLVEVVKKLLQPLRGHARPLAEWSEPIRALLLKIYGELELNPEFDEHRLVIQSSSKIHAACLEHGKVPDELAPVVTASQAIQMTLDQVRGEFLASLSQENALHLSGWLDMPMDDAPVAILTSLNEGFIPSAVNHDLFLPNRLRTHLGIEDNSRRYARDAYALSVVLHARQSVRLIAAKRDVRKEPLAPSRLLFATDPETIARRVVQFFDDSSADSKPVVEEFSTKRIHSDFKIPRPVPLAEPRRSFRVTEFRDYIASPYRYYLRHILGLGCLSDAVVELDPGGFGSLIHDVLQKFGLSDESTQSHSTEIARFLNQQLDDIVAARYGSDPLFPVHVQVEQIRHRLNHFAIWQAEWVRQGWEIRFTEIGTGKNVNFKLDDGSSITLRGRIDRVDYNERLKEWIIFDYKTSESGNGPDETHRQKDEWIDLQLPLYRHLAKPYGVTGNVRLGYITLPRTTTQIGEQIAEWTQSELAAADAKARQVAGSIIREEFWVELDRPPRWFDDYSGICQDEVFEREAIV